jgi:hypothetical protein
MPADLAQNILSCPKPGEGHSCHLAVYPKVEPKFKEALRASSQEDMTLLADYLTSDEPLGRNERDRLARMLPKGQKTGRPQKAQLRAAATVAVMFYKALRTANKAFGVKDHGHSAEMKEYAARATVEDYFSPDIEGMDEDEVGDYVMQVRDLMDRPEHRRAAKGGYVSFSMARRIALLPREDVAESKNLVVETAT